MLTAIRLNATTYPVEPGEREMLAAAQANLVAIEGQHPDEIIEAARHCDALLVVSSRVPHQVIDQLDQCRVISRLGAGTDRIDVVAATRRGIVVANVPDFCLHELADHVMALLLAWARRLPYMMNAFFRGDWCARHHPDVHRLAGQTLGLVGFGASAQAVAQRAKAFGLDILAYTRNREKYASLASSMGVTLVTLDELLRRSDFVSLHAPLTAETRHMIGVRELSLMKPTAVLINAARGAIVDEAALLAALREKRISGAALDVFDGIDVFMLPSRPPVHPLTELDNVMLTPHCAGSSVESSRESKLRGARHAADVLSGRLPPYVVNPEVAPRFPLQS